MLGVKLNFKGKSPPAAMTFESTQPTLDATTQSVRYNCTSSHSTLRSIQLQERIHYDHVTVLQKVKLHLRGCRAISWRIQREGRNVLQTFTASWTSTLIHLHRYNNESYPW